jgi:23S rRNA pseudouridine2605 synthase
MARHRRRKHTARPTGEPTAAGDQADHGPGERLQKVLAAAGVGSRRDCEELIREGRVEVDRRVVTELGTRVDPLRQEIRVDSETLRRPQRLYFAVNKPIGVVTTNFDPGGRPRVVDLVPTEERVFAVGRLDRASEGLILVTNDGEFANRITHPRYGVEKTYLVRVAGAPTPAELARLTKGVYLSDGFCRVQSIVAKKRQGRSTDLVMVLNEGRNRELRRVLARVGHKVLRLKRIAVGPIKLADLPSGAWRRLMPGEIESLLQLAKEKRKAAKGKGKRRPGDASQARSPAAPPVPGQREERPYLQQQALAAEPLSLEDLLKDDLDEAGVSEEHANDEATKLGSGGVIEYEQEPSTPYSTGRQTPSTTHRRKRPLHPPTGEQQHEQVPRESFGRKRGGRKVFGLPHQGRGPAGKTAGNFRYRDKDEIQGERRGGKRFGKPTGKKFGKPGGKRKGRR